MIMVEQDTKIKEQKLIDGVIYKVTNLVNEKTYIGLTTLGLEKRKKAHYSRARNPASPNTYFYRALNKYNEESFTWEIIDTATTKEELNAKEIYWIAFYNSYGNGGYNLTYGGEGNLGYVKPSWKNKKRKNLKQRIKFKDRVGELSNSAKLKEKDVLKIRDLIISGEPIESIAKKYNVSGGAIRGIKGGYNWSYLLTKEDIRKMNDSYRQNKMNKVLKIKDLLIEGVKSINEIAEIVNVKSGYISMIKNGEAWREIISDEDIDLMNQKSTRMDNELYSKINNVKDLLIEGVLTQVEIVEKTGMNSSTISQIKNGLLWSELFSEEDNKKLKERRALEPHRSDDYKKKKRNLKTNLITIDLIIKRAKKIDKKNKEIKIAEMLAQNKSVDDISNDLNVSKYLVYKFKKENKIDYVKPVIAQKESTLKRNEKIQKAIKTKDYLIEGIMTVKEIAAKLNVKESFVYSILSGKNRRDIITDEDVLKMQNNSIKRSGVKKGIIIRIKDLILENKYTDKEISEEMKVSTSFVFNIRSGKQKSEIFTVEEREALKELYMKNKKIIK